MVDVESFFDSFVFWDIGGRDNLSASSALAMLKGRNLEVLWVSGYVCLRGPDGGFVVSALDFDSTEYIHMIRSFL